MGNKAKTRGYRESLGATPHPPHPAAPRRVEPLILARLDRPLQVAAKVYGHVLTEARYADVPSATRMRVDGGAGPSGRISGHGRAARMLAELEAAIGPGEVCLGRPRGGRLVMVREVWCVRRVAVDWWSQAEVMRHLGLPNRGERGTALAEAVAGALWRMTACEAMAIYA